MSVKTKKAVTKKVVKADTFLPDDYELPKTESGYMKLQEGDNKIRILTSALTGWEGWKDSKPKRVAGSKNPFKPEDVDFDEKYQKPKYSHFWAFLVWNVTEKRIQILSITQKSIMGDLYNLFLNDDWGDPRNYGVTINKHVNGKTEYKVTPVPAKPLSDEIKTAWKNSPVTLDKIFETVEHGDEDAPKVKKSEESY